MTYGDLKLRLTQAFPGVSLDLIEGWIGDRYAEILGELPWSRLNVDAVLETTAPYTTGPVAVFRGSTAIAGTGTTWVTGMSGLQFRVAGRDEFYTFTWLTATTGTLDRPYEGPSAAGSSYSIFQNVYALPANCRTLQDTAFDKLQRFSIAQLNQSDPCRVQSGTPTAWASRMDDNSTPPNMEVELYPVPDQAIGIPYTYVSEAADLSSTSTILQVWMQPAALVEGVTGRIKAHLKDYTGATFHATLAKAALQNMRTSEAQGMAPAVMQLDSYYTRHRLRRGYR
jgi:hypothetical protein